MKRGKSPPVTNAATPPGSSADEASEASDQVGYGHPPQHSRWKKGQSGNRFGRPPGAKNYKTIVQDIAEETHMVKENGKWTRRSTVELVVLKLRNLAMEGNVRAYRAYKDILSKYAYYESGPTGGYLIVAEPLGLHEVQEEALRVKDAQAKKIAEFNKADAERRAQMKRPVKKPN